MSDVPLSLKITRPLIGVGGSADLELNDKTAYSVVLFGAGRRSWVRDTAAAPSVHGEVQVSARMGLGLAPVKVRALGASTAALKANAVAMVDAFSQLHFHLKVIWDTTWSEEWACYAADGGHDTSDGSFDTLLAIAHQQVYSWQVPRQPVPVSGVM